jgi:hypothetical protein
MKHSTGLLTLCLSLASFADSRAGKPGPPPLAITHVTVIDATGAAPQPDMTVVITGDRNTRKIAAVVVNGKLLEKATLEKMVAEVAEGYKK